MRYCQPGTHSASRTGHRSGNTFSGVPALLCVYSWTTRVPRNSDMGFPPGKESGFSPEAMKRTKSKFAVCIKNKGYPASLELRKIYRVVPDDVAAKHGQIRVTDESGEDYLYPLV